MVQGARTLEDRGEVLIFQSEDKMHWTHCNTITTPEIFGYMWECPDLFEIDGQWFLCVSPQGVAQTDDRFQNVYACGYFPLYGDFRGDCTLGEFQTLLSRQTNKTIFLSTHDLELALQIADKIWLMDKNKGVVIGTPEDLSLDGSLNQFFVRKGIVFEPATGLFRVDYECPLKIGLKGHGQRYAMVQKALQRNGIEGDSHFTDIYIDTDENNSNQFGIHVHGKEVICTDNIEGLLKIIKQLK